MVVRPMADVPAVPRARRWGRDPGTERGAGAGVPAPDHRHGPATTTVGPGDPPRRSPPRLAACGPGRRARRPAAVPVAVLGSRRWRRLARPSAGPAARDDPGGRR